MIVCNTLLVVHAWPPFVCWRSALTHVRALLPLVPMPRSFISDCLIGRWWTIFAGSWSTNANCSDRTRRRRPAEEPAATGARTRKLVPFRSHAAYSRRRVSAARPLDATIAVSTARCSAGATLCTGGSRGLPRRRCDLAHLGTTSWRPRRYARSSARSYRYSWHFLDILPCCWLFSVVLIRLPT